MEIYELSDREVRIILLKNFSELHEHTYTKLNKISKTMPEPKEVKEIKRPY